ncbi:MAG: type II toxin-antitoxin system RelE/ParE family toxin [Spirochaetales bacterium]|nr:type II toxin-antitoxin system RelE/ParE family toxin [Spirochaetales bacterium]
MMRTVDFYRTADGRCPVREYLDSLEPKDAVKIAFSISIVEELDVIPSSYFKHLDDGIYEIRAQRGGNIFRLLGFFFRGSLVILTNGFSKKTQKTPKKEISLAKDRRKDFLSRQGGRR